MNLILDLSVNDAAGDIPKLPLYSMDLWGRKSQVRHHQQMVALKEVLRDP